MGMTQTALARESAKKTQIEYTIYTYQQCGTKSQERWQKQDTVTDMAVAVQKAETFFDSGDFCKVEIKQKYMDSRNNRVVDTTLKVFERRIRKSLSAGAITVMAAFGGLVAFALTYFLSTGQS